MILGVLRRAPLSAYSVDRMIHSHTPLYKTFKRGNVYHAVAQLAKRGLLLGQPAQSKRGHRKSKSLYRLSAEGERYFTACLRETIADVHADDTTLEVGYVLLGQFPRSYALGALAERMRSIAAQERRLTRITGERESRRGAAYIAFLHTLSRLHDEQNFLRECIGLLKDPAWCPEWLDDDGPVNDSRRAL